MSKEEIPQMPVTTIDDPQVARKKRFEKSQSEIPQMQLVEAGKLDGFVSKPDEPSVAMMLQKVIDGGISNENVAALESLVGLYDRMQAKNAEREFSAALVELQGETIRVQATKAVDVKNGVPRYTFAPYEEIMRTVQPMLTRHGFSVTFDTKIDGDRLYSVCTLTHKAGHSRSNQFAVRFSTPPGASQPQGDMSTKNYAKRGAFCDAVNISIEHDDDARMIGQPISKALADDLVARVKACGADQEAFLKYAGAKDFYEISDERWPMLDEMLKRKEAAKAAREKLSTEEWK